jgi:hypothetical protein
MDIDLNLKINNMEKEFIPYEQALALKELGFDDKTFKSYDTSVVLVDGKYLLDNWYDVSTVDEVKAPLYQQAFRWFREKYNLFCEIQIDRTTEPKFCFDIFQYEHFGNYEKIEVKEWYLYRTQEEVELECLKKLIEIING